MEKKETFMTYEAPRIEIVEVEIEKGFATSSVGVSTIANSWDEEDGGSLGTY